MVLKSTIRVFIYLVLLHLINFSETVAQSTSATLQAGRLQADSELSIDGSLNEQQWKEADIASNFVQSTPNDGEPASQQTEVRVLYSDRYLYVGFMAFETAKDSITASLFRRDGSEASDWVYVNIDSYNDDRTAFTFAANPLCVQKDIMYFDDTQEDVLWDAVWEVSCSRNEKGWVAEFKIPLSQLRFTSSNTQQKWGINFQRRIARRSEISFWARTPREEYGLVSKFGELLGIENLARPLRLEVVPYVSSELTNNRTPSGENPFFENNKFKARAGADVKYGITSDLTLTATINPDFGQVEADPATFNLSEFENYFEERRPFFLEGTDIFNFGGTTSQNSYANHSNFYSRRIGKTPFAVEQRLSGFIEPATGDTNRFSYTSRNPITTIAGAAKISGKTKNGLSLGILNSYTVEERADFLEATSGETGSFMTEPATNYLVGRLRKDLSKTDAQIGGYFSSVNRLLNGSYLENYLHESAYQLGVDAQYYWDNRNWGASGVFTLSQVNGSPAALQRTQQSSARYLNRVDAKEFSLDSAMTSLSGYFGEFSIGKYSGSGLRYSFTYSEMSPGYEVNDIGFLERADYRAPHYYTEYLNVNTENVLFYLVWADASHAWNFDGAMIFNYYSTGIYTQLNNFWTVLATFGLTGRFYNDRITRGGPTMLRPKDWNSYISITSNTARKFYGSFSSSYRRDAAGEYQVTFNVGADFRPTSNIKLALKQGYIQSLDLDQFAWFWDVTPQNNSAVLFSDMNLNLIFTELRADITFTPTISLQTYLRPYYYTADFENYKMFSESRTFNFQPIDSETDTFYSSNYDLDNKTLQGNAVLRWEYTPGSTLFLVWEQTRDVLQLSNANFEAYNGVVDTFRNKPVNIFLLKLSYWFGN